MIAGSAANGGVAFVVPKLTVLKLVNFTLDGSLAGQATAVVSSSSFQADGVTVRGFSRGGLMVNQGSVSLSRSNFTNNTRAVTCSKANVILDEVRATEVQAGLCRVLIGSGLQDTSDRLSP